MTVDIPDVEVLCIEKESKKLDTKWLGPYTIQEVLPRGIYVVSLPDGTGVRSSTGAHLKPYNLSLNTNHIQMVNQHGDLAVSFGLHIFC